MAYVVLKTFTGQVPITLWDLDLVSLAQVPYFITEIEFLGCQGAINLTFFDLEYVYSQYPISDLWLIGQSIIFMALS